MEQTITIDDLRLAHDKLERTLTAKKEFVESIGEFAVNLSNELRAHTIDPGLHNAIARLLVAYVGVQQMEIQAVSDQLDWTGKTIMDVLATVAQPSNVASGRRIVTATTRFDPQG